MRHGLDHVGSGNEHVRRVLDHNVEVGDCRTVNRTAGAGSHDATNLRYHSARQGVAQENVGVASQTHHAFLNARAAGIVQADDRNTDLHCQVENLANLFCVRFRERTTEDCEVLSKHNHAPPVYQPIAGNYTIARIELLVETEVLRTMHHEFAKLFKALLIKQEVDPLARRHFFCRVLLFDALCAATLFCLQ
jgi:hypothetical protein